MNLEKIDQLQTDDSCDKLMENAWAGQHFHTVVCSFIAEFLSAVQHLTLLGNMMTS